MLGHLDLANKYISATTSVPQCQETLFSGVCVCW